MSMHRSSSGRTRSALDVRKKKLSAEGRTICFALFFRDATAETVEFARKKATKDRKRDLLRCFPSVRTFAGSPDLGPGLRYGRSGGCANEIQPYTRVWSPKLVVVFRLRHPCASSRFGLIDFGSKINHPGVPGVSAHLLSFVLGFLFSLVNLVLCARPGQSRVYVSCGFV